MTQDDAARVEVTQADRDLLKALGQLDSIGLKMLDAGKLDHLHELQTLARHRLSADDGFVRVPREADEAQVRAGMQGRDDTIPAAVVRDMYARMIAAVGEG